MSENKPIYVSGRGGKREGAGRKEALPHLKRKMISVRLPVWLIDKLKEQPGSQSVIIEESLIASMGLEIPTS